MVKFLIITVFVWVSGDLIATQKNCPDSLGGDRFAFIADQQAKYAAARIVRYTGLEQNFTIIPAEVSTAVAYVKGRERVIAYNPDFIVGMKNKTGTNWAALSILAHEIGHHLSGHTLKGEAGNPGDELAADKFSGFILARMGASLDEAKAAMESLPDSGISKKHPPRSSRLAAITNGWMEAADLDRETRGLDCLDHASIALDSVKRKIHFQCSFTDDPNFYFVDDLNRIIWFDNQGAPIVIGSRQPSNNKRFAWRYVYQDTSYGVDSQGVMWNETNHGAVFKVGEASPY